MWLVFLNMVQWIVENQSKILRLHNYEEQDKPVLLFIRGVENWRRDQAGYVSSRIGVRREAIPILAIHLFTKLSKVKRWNLVFWLMNLNSYQNNTFSNSAQVTN